MGTSKVVNPDSIVSMTPKTAWKLFSKGIKPDQVKDTVQILGDRSLGERALQMISVMA